jgi:deoxyribodipyrimidine photo-lyase
MRALVWFRSDLRVLDNPALAAALDAADEGVEAVFLSCADQWREHDWGPLKVDFVKRSAEELLRALSGLGIELIEIPVSLFAEAPEAMLQVARARGCDAVFANREYEFNERRRDDLVESAMIAAGRTVTWFHDQVIVPPGQLLSKAGDFYSVFSAFRRAWLERVESEGLPEPGEVAREAPWTAGESQGGLWPAGEVEARRRLKEFIAQRIESYDEARDIASLEATSRISPYLSVGSISVLRCLNEAVAANGGRLSGGTPGVDTWISEIIWREFYRHVLVGFPRVSRSRAFRTETERLGWRTSQRDFEAWCAGRTGVPFVDAGMRQLKETGWMHNRLRMVTAMFLTKNLLIDWRWGERFFMQHLVDGDLASNNGGWQWSASTGTDAAPYFRIFNPWTQAKRFDPEGEYIRRWVPELEEVSVRDLHDPKRLTSHLRRIDYPRPIVGQKASRIRALAAFKAIKDA